MSDFTTEGHEPYPDLHLDRQKLMEIGAEAIEGYVYSTQYIEEQVGFYTRFLARANVLPQHRIRADGNLDRYIFELAYRDGVYDPPEKREDEISECA